MSCYALPSPTNPAQGSPSSSKTMSPRSRYSTKTAYGSTHPLKKVLSCATSGSTLSGTRPGSSRPQSTECATRRRLSGTRYPSSSLRMRMPSWMFWSAVKRVGSGRKSTRRLTWGICILGGCCQRAGNILLAFGISMCRRRSGVIGCS
jgi:hypothetical protein